MRQLPGGTITLLFTDMEGSTRLLRQLGGSRYAAVLKECRRLLRAAFQQGHGYEVDTQGDAFFVVFERAIDAVTTAMAAQRALCAAHWPDEVAVRMRMGIHTGDAQPTEDGYVGRDVHLAARLMSVGHGGQILLSGTTHDLLAAALPAGVSMRELGACRLKDIAGMTRLFQVVGEGLPTDFSPLSTVSRQPFLSALPAPSTSFVGREREVSAVRDLLMRADARLLALIGTAGVGKTRLALYATAALADQFAGGICFVALEQVSDPDGLLPAIAQALFVQEEKGEALADQVKASLREQSLLLILDTFEHLLPARLLVADLLAHCPHLTILVTSRVMLHIQAE